MPPSRYEQIAELLMRGLRLRESKGAVAMLKLGFVASYSAVSAASAEQHATWIQRGPL